MQPFFADFYERLQELHQGFASAIENMPVEGLDWKPGPDMNSLCELIMHTTGAERFWIGDVALGESSNRDRASEFQAHGLSAAALKERLDTVEAYSRGALERLTLADLETMRPRPGRDDQFTIGWSLLHVLDHCGEHLGHAQITRQLWDQRLTGLG